MTGTPYVFGSGPGPHHIDASALVEAMSDQLAAEQTTQFPPVTPGMLPTEEMAAVAAQVRHHWEAAPEFSSTHVVFEEPVAPLLPGWGWPMADPEDPTPIFDAVTEALRASDSGPDDMVRTDEQT